MAPVEHHWVCDHCQRTYAAEPLKCECGARGFTRVELETGGTRMSVAPAKLLDRSPVQRLEVSCRRCSKTSEMRPVGNVVLCPLCGRGDAISFVGEV